jgi:rod shape-determining protein MreD
MKPTFGQRLDTFTRNSLPVLFTLVLVLINVVPLHIPGFSRIVPVLPLMAVYHWAVYRPELMPPLAVFFIGVIYDILSGTPLGVNALVFLTIYGVVVFQQRFFAGRSFVIVWLGFGIMAFAASVEAWILVSILTESIVEPRALVFQYILNVGFFPMLAWLFLRWQHFYLRSE